MENKLRAAIIGTGNIGTDILLKLMRSKELTCSYFVGRNKESNNFEIAKRHAIETSSEGIVALEKSPEKFDIVFDASSALSHIENAKILGNLRKKIINLTPEKIGAFCIPAINLHEMENESNLNMVTCGGQASAPIAYAFSKVHSKIDYIEVVSSISAKSAGPATRLNIDEYLSTTETAIKQFSGCLHAKAILNINPAIPEVDMKTTIMALIKNPDLDEIKKEVERICLAIHRYVPGYEIVVPPFLKDNYVVVMVKVRGAGDFLPTYAGNLDIITSAALSAAEYLAKKGKGLWEA